MSVTWVPRPLSDRNRVWVNRSYRVIAWAWLAMVAGLGLALVFTPGMTWWDSVLVGLVFAGIGTVGWAVYGAPTLSICDDRVVVRNPFRLIEVPVTSIREVEAGQHLSLHLRNGRVVRVWCIQTANVSLLLRRRSHTDQVAAELREALSSVPGVAVLPELVERSPALLPLAVEVAVASAAAGLLRLLVR